ncbi:ammonium transporter [Gracilimonas mengyeensis]|uniref:Ammonium transporter n=1 Tax=Gracilimonas mengyeensis TaxID=1302730 RepID=A0A521D4E7_9BACT|nr:ammonium transporter [Gracilimonas mengyeensis]SMO66549.1 ammonium transporter [Gracilimonas mengyeensis]
MKLRYGIILTVLLLMLGTTAYAFPEAVENVSENAEVLIQTNGNEYTSMEDFEASTDYIIFTVNNLWILIAAFMVLMMHLGFATVESGLTQAKNAVNVIYKNVFILTVGILLYALVGFQIMYPGDFNGFLGFGGFGIGFDPSNLVGMLTPAYGLDMTIWTDFIFQAMFAATAATIVSGCVTGRIKLPAFMIFGVLLLAFCYPVTGSWHWGGGWLSELGFYDFAGSTLVHAVGGAAGLACVLLLGPRSGKYEGGKIHGIPAHNIPLATVGVFILFLGWFGFNGGSVLNADPVGVSYVFVTTALAACSGAIAAMVTTQIVMKTLDAPMALNGILAGLVGITAGADAVGIMDAVFIGAIAGVIVVFSILMFDKLKIDDPVGAISVHGVVGIWGTIAVGIFSPDVSFGVQVLGTLSIAAFTFVFSLAVFGAIKAIMGVRVSKEVESDGLDISEHGSHAYPEFSPVKTSELGAFAD